jgi:hypothetical protein
VLPPTSADLARRIRAAAAHVEPPAATSAESAEVDAFAPPLLPSRRRAPEAESVGEQIAARPADDTVELNEPSPLPRRARNRSAVRESAPSVSAALADAQLLDAEAARAAVEEFEAGVEEALRESQNLPIIRASDEPEGIRP